MMHTVGLIGANGGLGSAAAKSLASSAKDGKIKLVILHRAGKPPKDIEGQDNIQLRVVDLDGPAADLEVAVQGIKMFISALGLEGIRSEPNLVDALAKSKDLVTFIPAVFSTTWSEEDFADPLLGGMLRMMHSSSDRAKEKGLGITDVYTGLFDSYFFDHSLVGCDLKENVVWANKKQLANEFPITTMDHIAHVLNRLAIADPQSIKNASHSIVMFWPTGQEVADLYAKINGKPAEVKDFTSKDRDEVRANGGIPGLAQVGYRDHWENGRWEYESGGKLYDKTYSGPEIEEVARRFA